MLFPTLYFFIFIWAKKKQTKVLGKFDWITRNVLFIRAFHQLVVSSLFLAYTYTHASTATHTHTRTHAHVYILKDGMNKLYCMVKVITMIQKYCFTLLCKKRAVYLSGRPVVFNSMVVQRLKCLSYTHLWMFITNNSRYQWRKTYQNGSQILENVNVKFHPTSGQRSELWP